MRERLSTYGYAFGLVIIGVLCGIALGLVWPSGSGLIGLGVPLALSFAAMELVPLPLPRGGRFRLDAGVAIAAMLLLDPLSAGLTALVGSALGVLAVRYRSVSRQDVIEVLRTGCTIIVAAAAWRYFGLTRVVEPSTVGSWVSAVGLGLLYMALDLGGWTVLQTRASGATIHRSVGNIVGLLGTVYVGQLSAGIATAVVEASLGVVAILALLLLILIMQHTFGLLLRVKAAYTMTVSALSRVAEMSQGVQLGHGERVAELSASVGRRLSLSAASVERLTLAALLHDIGGVGGEDAEEVGRNSEGRRASLGATLISRVNFLSSLAPVIARSASPYAEYVETQDVDGLLSRIVRVTSDYDLMVNTDGLVPSDALVAISQHSGSEYDPVVLDALGDVVRMAGTPS